MVFGHSFYCQTISERTCMFVSGTSKTKTVNIYKCPCPSLLHWLSPPTMFVCWLKWKSLCPVSEYWTGKPRVGYFLPAMLLGLFSPLELALWDPVASSHLSRSDECGIWILMNIIMPQNFPKFWMLGPFPILCKATHLEE